MSSRTTKGTSSELLSVVESVKWNKLMEQYCKLECKEHVQTGDRSEELAAKSSFELKPWYTLCSAVHKYPKIEFLTSERESETCIQSQLSSEMTSMSLTVEWDDALLLNVGHAFSDLILLQPCTDLCTFFSIASFSLEIWIREPETINVSPVLLSYSIIFVFLLYSYSYYIHISAQLR